MIIQKYDKMVKESSFLLLLMIVVFGKAYAQTTCPLLFGTNLSGINDWTTEMPFVDVMHQSREWYTTTATPFGPWDTQKIGSIPKDTDGYPLEVPYTVDGVPQIVKTVWANMSAWQEGTYLLLYEGDGDFEFWGDFTIVSSSPGRIVLNFTRNTIPEGIAQLSIKRSNISNHVRNIRILMQEHEATYQTHPFNPLFIQKLAPFKVLRFMDWGGTNNWGNPDAYSSYDEDADTIKINWADRAQMSNYTWATNKGVPYEMMIDLCNQTNKDLWICIPHSASNDHIRNMATLVKTRLNPNLHVYVEYSNELWNWMFGQTQWINKFGPSNLDWPQRIAFYVQNALDRWTEGFDGQLNRLTRVVGVQAAWQDVSNRIIAPLRIDSYDAFAPAAYFGISEAADARLDVLGASATINDIATEVRASMQTNEMVWLTQQKQHIADVKNKPMLFYEGGQHLTPTPFGVEPTYAQALLDIQRDPVMYDLYNEWFTFLKTLSTSSSPSLFMNFSFVGSRSAKYGSWGVLEMLNQNITQIPAPKYSALLNQINSCITCQTTYTTEYQIKRN